MTTMTLAAPTRMAKKGRPRKGEKAASDPTQLIRVREQTAEILTLVAKARGVSVADLVEYLVRPTLLESYAEVFAHLSAARDVQVASAEAMGLDAPAPLPDPLVSHPQTGELVPLSSLHSASKKKSKT